VQNSSFEQANFGYAIYDFSYGGAPAEVTGAHSFTDNTISGPNGIFVNAGFASAPLAESSYLGQITISNNTYSSPVSSGIAIRLENSPVGAASSVATMDLVSITGNSAIGNGAAGVGVQLTGKIAGSVIAKNNIRGFATAVELANSSRSPADAPSGTQVNRNQIVDNGGAAKSGLATGSAVTGVNAANNWWGCNAGPPVGAAAQVSDCDSAVLANTGSAAVEPHMLLAITADQSTLGNSASSSVTGAITQNSQGDSVPVVIPDGTPYLFSGTGGSVSASSAPTTAGAAGVVFTSAAPTGRSASVTYDHQTVTHTWPDNDAAPPVITITSPANRSIVDQPTITLNYTVNEGATCTPPPGSKVDLNVGVNTIVVTCTDANGNVSTASVQVVRPDALPACAASVVITNVRRSGSRSVVSGFARLRFAGQKISLRYMPSGSRTIARPTVRSNGSWTATVNRPKRPSYKSNDARYRAVLGSTKTRWIKLTRRMGSTTVTSAGTGALSVKGSVSKPLAPGQRVRVERSDACGKYRQIGSVSVRRSGSFSGKVSDGGSSDVAVFIRLKLRVRSSSGTRFNTYSIVQPVILKR
jgi:hypothetical protein